MSEYYLIIMLAKNLTITKIVMKSFLLEYLENILRKCFTKKSLKSLVILSKNKLIMKDHNHLISNQNLIDKKSDIFIFRYDPTSSFEGIFEEF